MNLKLVLLLSLIGTISGCNSGTDEGDASSNANLAAPESVIIEALQTKSKAIIGEDSSVEVIAKNDAKVAMEAVSVRLISGGTCHATSIDGMSFTTSSTQIGECQFEYTVEPVEKEIYLGQASSLARVSVSETAENNTLPNLSETTDVDSPITIDLSEELEGDLDAASYTVSDEYTQLGTGSVEVNSVSNTITYTPADIGVTRIMYSMSDGASTKLGNIDVAVSDTENTPPVANNYIREGKLAKDMSVEIDLTEDVSDSEDSVILDSVRAYNAETQITSATEHTFMFQSSGAGPHEVAYTIKDGRGGYAVGQVYIEVEPDFSLVQDWDDITIYDSTISADLTFTAPASKVLADYTNTAYTSTQTQDGISGPKYSEVVTMDLDQAQNYCAPRNGRLPIRREWELLLASQGNLFESRNWPAGMQFWSADMLSELSGNSYNAIDLGTEELSKDKGMGFVTCVLFDSTSVNDFNTEIELGEQDGLNIGLYFTVTDPDGKKAPYQNISVTAENSKGVFSNYMDQILLVSDVNGYAEEQYQDTSFDPEVVSANVSSSQKNSEAIHLGIELSEVDTTDPTQWNAAVTYGAGLAPLNEISDAGIPLLYKANTTSSIYEMAAVHKESFVGSSLLAKYELHIDGNPSSLDAGKATFVIQQYSNTPIHSEWGYASAYQEGLPHSDKVVSVEVNYYSQNITLLVGNNHIETIVDPTRVDMVSLPTRYETWYIWIVIVDTTIDVYASTESERPDEPSLSSHNVWHHIDPTQPYWVGFGSNPYVIDGSEILYAQSLWVSD